ncbi:sugar transferase [Vampirovibrio chlorellavorus]|uniref:sugar transferase n=1 Tax=Vampirovibrio chlorellavorus TaxID=758823 RepID=UPI0026F02892|nr:sugar transferase [Vampirovibrio chlorellavorus]
MSTSSFAAIPPVTGPASAPVKGHSSSTPQPRLHAFSDSVWRLQLMFLNRSVHWGYQAQQFLKRAFDVLAASLGLLAIAPLLLLIAALVKFTSPGPILYKSQRIGKNFQPFGMYKFRTMSVDADAQREALRQQTEQTNGLFKLANDPRVTEVGKVLRALSLDELPQLLNVIRGEMSLVGPRPLPQDESELFQEPYTLRFQVFPGMTGAWQVGGRSNLSFEQLCQLEMNYVINWTLLADIKILLKTLPAVLASRGAY